MAERGVNDEDRPPTERHQTSEAPHVTAASHMRGFICCSHPHGGFSYFPSLFMTAAFILSIYAHFSCSFIERSIVIAEERGQEGDMYSAYSIGLWYFMDPGISGICFYYPKQIVFDTHFKIARAMSGLAAVMGGLIMVVAWFSTCIGIPKVFWRFFGVCLILVALFEGLTFLVFDSQFCTSHYEFTYDCRLAKGGQCGIAATVFWFFAALSVIKPPSAQDIPEFYPAYVTNIRTETIQPDGTKVVNTRTITEHL